MLKKPPPPPLPSLPPLNLILSTIGELIDTAPQFLRVFYKKLKNSFSFNKIFPEDIIKLNKFFKKIKPNQAQSLKFNDQSFEDFSYNDEWDDDIDKKDSLSTIKKAPRVMATPKYKNGSIFIFDNDKKLIDNLRRILDEKFQLIISDDQNKALKTLSSRFFDYILIDLMMEQERGIKFYYYLIKNFPKLDKRSFFLVPKNIMSDELNNFLKTFENSKRIIISPFPENDLLKYFKSGSVYPLL